MKPTARTERLYLVASGNERGSNEVQIGGASSGITVYEVRSGA